MTNKLLQQQVQEKFTELFQKPSQLFSAPGRINLIGEHTDYNEGLVLPAAIDKIILFGLQKNDLGKFRFYSMDYEEYQEFDNISLPKNSALWSKYLLGVLAQFKNKGYNLSGFDCVFGGNIPLGAGLSSSAALECGFAFGINELSEYKIPLFDLVRMAQKAEQEYAGVMCGIMDQYASIFGKRNQVFQLDCRTNTHKYFPFETTEHSLLLVDTKVKHSLASTAYNQRREECERGVSYFQQFDSSVQSLRDVSLNLLQQHKNKPNEVVYQRCKYVIEENRRVLQATKALKNHDFTKLGELLYQSHQGLQQDYNVSCPELDFLVNISKRQANVLGARMMGGGFGGCTLNLIKKSFIEDFKKIINEAYQKEFDIEPAFYLVQIDKGTSFVKYFD